MISLQDGLRPIAHLAHHSEPGDPELLEWIRHQIDGVLGMGPVHIAVLFGSLILVIPVGIGVVFILNRLRGVWS